MKLKALIAVLFVAGFASSFALASGDGTRVATTTGTTTTGTTSTSTTGTTTTTPSPSKCQKVELKGSNGSGSVTFTVDKTSNKASDLAGKPLTLTIPAGATVQANACRDASGALTLRGLHVLVKSDQGKGDDHEGDNQNGSNGKDKGKHGKKGD
jgi:hypothetical protein